MPTRKPSKYRVITVALLAVLLPAWAQQPAAPAPASASAAAPAAAIPQEELDKLLAPIALYPDALVAQILMGSTFPSKSSRRRAG